jgi:hypothetical protein
LHTGLQVLAEQISLILSTYQVVAHVVGNGGVSHKDQSGSRIRDGGESRLGVSCRAHFIRRRRIFPKAVRVVNGCILYGARVLRRVGVSKVVRPVGIEWEIGSK